MIISRFFGSVALLVRNSLKKQSPHTPCAQVHTHPKNFRMKRVNRNKQESSLNIKKKKTGPKVSSFIDISVLCNGYGGFAKSVLVKLDADMYLINCGEASQRFLPLVGRERGRINNVFFTHNTWNNVGGLIGILLTINADLKRSEPLKIHGPEHTAKILKMTSFFSEVDINTSIEFNEVGSKDIAYADEQITMESVELLPDSLCTESTAATGSGLLGKSKKAVAYIMTPQPTDPKVDVDKLISLGYKSGPWIGKLVRGETVTMEDGKVICPEDVTQGLGEHPRTIFFLECPTTDFLESMITSEKLNELSTKTERIPEVIVHMSPVDVMKHPKYQQFMDRFLDKDTIHIILNEDCRLPVMTKTCRFANMMNLIDEDLFPQLEFFKEYSKPIVPPEGKVINALSTLTYSLRKKIGGADGNESKFSWEHLQNLALEDTRREPLKVQSVQEEIDILSKKQAEFPSVNGVSYPEFVFLGTGSSKPTAYRNASGILVQMRKDEYMMLDCGEGSLLQMYLMYGEEGTNHILRNLKGIFISHLHFDHHGGLFGILAARKKVIAAEGREDRLLALVPRSYRKWVSLYSDYVEDVYKNIDMESHHFFLTPGSTPSLKASLKNIKTTLGLKEYVPVQVKHVSNSYGVVITHEDGWRVTYSGDTMPHTELARQGKNSDILIHEATFCDDEEDKAVLTRHSTSGQAIAIGQAMSAKFTMLTHFSQRHAKAPVFSKDFTDNVGFSYDFMRIHMGNLHRIPLLKGLIWSLLTDQEKETVIRRVLQKEPEPSRMILLGEPGHWDKFEGFFDKLKSVTKESNKTSDNEMKGVKRKAEGDSETQDTIEENMDEEVTQCEDIKS